MNILLEDFVKENIGKKGVGNTPDNKGQCTGLANIWIGLLNLSHLWGNAKDMFDNALPTEYKKIKNSPKAYPNPGDILVFKGTSDNGYYGHVGVVYASSKETNVFVLFEQNNWIGDSTPQCELTTYENWESVIGWLHPLVLDSTENIDNLSDSLCEVLNIEKGSNKNKQILDATMGLKEKYKLQKKDIEDYKKLVSLLEGEIRDQSKEIKKLNGVINSNDPLAKYSNLDLIKVIVDRIIGGK